MTYVPSLSAIQIFTLDEDRWDIWEVLFVYFESLHAVCSISRSLRSSLSKTNAASGSGAISLLSLARFLCFDAGVPRSLPLLPDEVEEKARERGRGVKVRGDRMSVFFSRFSPVPTLSRKKKRDENRERNTRHSPSLFLYLSPVHFFLQATDAASLRRARAK